jgi:hypothetical protein
MSVVSSLPQNAIAGRRQCAWMPGLLVCHHLVAKVAPLIYKGLPVAKSFVQCGCRNTKDAKDRERREGWMRGRCVTDWISGKRGR